MSATRRRPPRSERTLRRLALAAGAAIAFCFALQVWFAWLNRATATPVGADVNWSGSGVLGFLAFAPLLLFPVVGFLLAWKRPRNAIGWVMLGIGLSLALPLDGYARYALLTRHGELPFGAAAEALNQPTWVPLIGLAGVFLILLFPDGHLPSPRWRWFARACGVGMGLGMVAILTSPGRFETLPQVSNPFGIHGAEPFLLLVLSVPVGIVGATVSLVGRYRRATGTDRLQLKWLVAAVSVLAVIYAIVEPLSAGVGSPTPAWLTALQELAILPFGLIPIAIAFAVLRYRLYDIDVVISKAIVYGALAVFTTVAYVLIVVGVGTVLGITGDRRILGVLGTAVVALGFQPVRSRMQRVANRLVYGERATPYEVLARFSDRVAGTYATEDVLPRTAMVLAEGIGAERTGIWLRVGSELRLAASWPDADGAPPRIPLSGGAMPSVPAVDRTVPVVHRDELLGAITATKPRGEAFTPTEERLLEDLAQQASLVLSNVRLTAELEARLEEIATRASELRASRQRIVAAQDEERRRLERNIHDGAQQHLVALAVKLRLARSFVRRDPERARSMLAELDAEVDAALDTLTSLSLGIYPPLLQEQGLAAALVAQYQRSGLPVHLAVDGVARYPIEAEAAVYFCVLEALQNAAKHAGAKRIDVRIGADGGDLSFEVTDDGAGFDPATAPPGSGLQNLADRLSVLGGEAKIESRPGRGTRVRGRVPLGERVAT